MKRKLATIIGIGALSLALVGCGSKETEESKSNDGKTVVSFNWWGSEVRHEKYIEAIELFEKNNPDIDIEYEYGAWDDYWKKLATKSAAGDLPDVMQMDAGYLSQYGVKNQLTDLSEYTSSGTINTDKINESVVSSGKIDEKLFAIAPSMNAMSMIVNKKVTDEAGVSIDYSSYSFDDFVQATRDVHEKTGKYGWIDVVDNSVLLQYYLRTQGEELFKYNNDGKPELAFSEENFIKFMTTIQELAKEEAIPTAEVASNVKSFDENPLSIGDVALYETWTNQFVAYQESASDGVSFDLELPFDSKDTGALFYRPTFYYSVSQTSTEKEAAAKFVDFLVNDEEANKIIGTERGIPSNTDAKKAIYDQMSDTEKRTADYLDEIEPLVGEASPVPPLGYSELNTHFKDLFAEMTYGTMSAEEAYKSFVGKAGEIFDENYQ